MKIGFRKRFLAFTVAAAMVFAAAPGLVMAAPGDVTGVKIVSPTLNAKPGTTVQMVAVITPADAVNRHLTWSSSNPAVATVDGNGLVTVPATAKTGSVRITAVADNGVSTLNLLMITAGTTPGICAVTSNVSLAPGAGGTVTFNIYTYAIGNKTPVAASFDQDGASAAPIAISNNTAVAVASIPAGFTPGVHVVTFTCTGALGPISCAAQFTVPQGAVVVPVTGVAVSPEAVSLNVNGTQQLVAAVSPVDATNQSVTWASDNPAVAAVDANGLVTAVSGGAANITATTADGGFTASCAVTVTVPPTAITNVRFTSDSGVNGGAVMGFGSTMKLTFDTTGDMFPSTKPVVWFKVGGQVTDATTVRDFAEAIPVVTQTGPHSWQATLQYNFSDHVTGTDTQHRPSSVPINFGDVSGPVSFSISGVGADGNDIATVTATGDGSGVTLDNTLPPIPSAPVLVPPAGSEADPYWNSAVYSQIENAVNSNIPSFLLGDNMPQFVITDQKYAGLVRTVTEDGQTTPVNDYTEVFKAAIADASAAGGGKVVVPYTEEGVNTYYTGAITLLSNVNLVVTTGTTIKFIRIINNNYYPVVLAGFEGQDLYNWSPFIYALNQKNIAITGGGTLDGQASANYWINMASGIDKIVLNSQCDDNMPVVKRIYVDASGVAPAKIPVIDGNTVKYVAPPKNAVITAGSKYRPCFVSPQYCQNIIISGVNIINSPMWEVNPISCQNILVDGLNISSHNGNNDGVNPESCQNVIIQNVTFSTGDDCIAIKSDKNGDGLRKAQPSQYIIVRGCNFADGHGGVTCGSEISGGIKWVFAENNSFNSANLQSCLRFKMNSFRGGVIENIYERNSTVTAATSAVLLIDSAYTAGNAQDALGDIARYTPHINNIYISGFTTGARADGSGSNIKASNFISQTAYSRAPINGVHIRDSEFYGVGNMSMTNNVNWEYINVKTSPTTALTTVTTLNSIPSKITNVKLTDGTNTVNLIDTVSNGNNNVVTMPRTTNTAFTVTGFVQTAQTTAPVVNVYQDRSTSATAATVTPADGGYNFTANITVATTNQSHYINILSAGSTTATNANYINRAMFVSNVLFAPVVVPPVDNTISVAKAAGAKLVASVNPELNAIYSAPGLTVENFAANIAVSDNAGYQIQSSDGTPKTSGLIYNGDKVYAANKTVPGVNLTYAIYVAQQLYATVPMSKTMPSPTDANYDQFAWSLPSPPASTYNLPGTTTASINSTSSLTNTNTDARTVQFLPVDGAIAFVYFPNDPTAWATLTLKKSAQIPSGAYALEFVGDTGFMGGNDNVYVNDALAGQLNSAAANFMYSAGTSKTFYLQEVGRANIDTANGVVIKFIPTVSNTGQTKIGIVRLVLVGPYAPPASAAPIINPVTAGDTVVTGTGVNGATVVVTFPNGDTATATVINGVWTANVTAGFTLIAGDPVKAVQTEPGKTKSDTATATVLAVTPPVYVAAPYALQAPTLSNDDTSIALVWQKPAGYDDPADPVVNYNVYRDGVKIGDANGFAAAEAAASTEASPTAPGLIQKFYAENPDAQPITYHFYIDKNLAPSTPHAYTVTAIGKLGDESAPSAALTVSTTATPKVFNVEADYGAVGDGKTVNTAAIQSAINDASAYGAAAPAKVLIPAGKTFVTGSLNVKSNITIDVEGTLLGSPDAADYTYGNMTSNRYDGIFNAKSGVDNLRIVGGGTVNGNGWRPAPELRTTNPLLGGGPQYYKTNPDNYLADAIASNAGYLVASECGVGGPSHGLTGDNQYNCRGTMVQLDGCAHVYFGDITFRDPAFHDILSGTATVMNNVKVFSYDTNNGDGVSAGGTLNKATGIATSVIFNTVIDAGDDAINGSGLWTLDNYIAHTHGFAHCSGTGYELFEDSVGYGCAAGFRFKGALGSATEIANITFRDIALKNIHNNDGYNPRDPAGNNNYAFAFNGAYVDPTKYTTPGTGNDPFFHDITVKNVTVKNDTALPGGAIWLLGSNRPGKTGGTAYNINFTNVHFMGNFGPQYGHTVDIDHLRDSVFDNVTFDAGTPVPWKLGDSAYVYNNQFINGTPQPAPTDYATPDITVGAVTVVGGNAVTSTSGVNAAANGVGQVIVNLTGTPTEANLALTLGSGQTASIASIVPMYDPTNPWLRILPTDVTDISDITVGVSPDAVYVPLIGTASGASRRFSIVISDPSHKSIRYDVTIKMP